MNNTKIIIINFDFGRPKPFEWVTTTTTTEAIKENQSNNNKMLTSSIFCCLIYSFKSVVECGRRVVLLIPHQITPAEDGDDDDDNEFDEDDDDDEENDTVSPVNPIGKPELDLGFVELLRLGNHVSETLALPEYFSRSSGSPKPRCFFPSNFP